MNNFHAWLWPDRSIGKRESRQLREEHNALVNSSDALISVLRYVQRNTRHERTLQIVTMVLQGQDPSEILRQEGADCEFCAGTITSHSQFCPSYKSP